MRFTDSFLLAWQTIKGNKLRTGITVTIIALGIMALMVIITSIEAMNQSLRESFSTMGANAFSIRFRDRQFRVGGGNRRAVTKTNKANLKQRASNEGRAISYQEAKAFKDRFTFPATVSISLRGSNNTTVMYVTNQSSVTTNPNVSLQGGDENYLALNGYNIAAGHNFSDLDVETGRNVCILGNEMVTKLFKGNALQAVDKIVKIGNLPYRVIAVMKPKGSSAFLNLDNIVITTYNNARRLPNAASSFSIGIMVKDYKLMEDAIGQATGTFRPIRKLDVEDDDNFYIDKSDALAETFIGFLKGISGVTVIIGFLTLMGAAIGLMNIMLVAVTERTKEVGLIKALGGTKKIVRQQFLFESVIISSMGAVIGIVLGVLGGNLIGLALGTGFIIPWFWVVMGIIICFLTGLGAGYYPARKAARLDPIVALRYE
jgi:putative ABC transport system permease protein